MASEKILSALRFFSPWWYKIPILPSPQSGPLTARLYNWYLYGDVLDGHHGGGLPLNLEKVLFHIKGQTVKNSML